MPPSAPTELDDVYRMYGRAIVYAAPLADDADTLPAVIVASQCAAVAESAPSIIKTWRARRLYPTPAQLALCVSNDIDLPPWNCLRCLAALELVPPLTKALTDQQKRKTGTARYDKVVAFIRKSDRFVTLAEIVVGTKLTREHVRSILRWEPSPFKRIAVVKNGPRGGIYAYQMRSFGKAPAP